MFHKQSILLVRQLKKTYFYYKYKGYDMRNLFVIIFILLNISYSQVTSSLQAWENILQTPELVEYFQGIFNNLGVTVEETGEEFTIQHTGDGYDFEMGINEEKVDFIVPVKLQNIQNMIAH